MQQLLLRDEEPRIYSCEGIFIFHSFLHLRFLVNNNFYINKTRTGFLAQCQRDASFPNFLWTDEATFTPNGIFNSRNNLFWHDENSIR